MAQRAREQRKFDGTSIASRLLAQVVLISKRKRKRKMFSGASFGCSLSCSTSGIFLGKLVLGDRIRVHVGRHGHEFMTCVLSVHSKMF